MFRFNHKFNPKPLFKINDGLQDLLRNKCTEWVFTVQPFRIFDDDFDQKLFQ